MAAKRPKSNKTPACKFTPASNNPSPNFTPTSDRDIAKKASGFYDVKISWNIGRMARDGSFCCSLATLHDYHNNIAKYEGQKYKQIFARGSGNRHDHAMPVKLLDVPMRNALLRQGIDIEAEVHQIHLGRIERLFGVIEDGIFHILLFDPTHDGYKSK